MTNNINISQIEQIIKPLQAKQHFTINTENEKQIRKWRNEIANIINGKDNRLLLIVGPCSIHDYDVAINYAKELKKLSDLYSDKLMIVMRVYFEKPRSTIGWRGLINDPMLDDSCHINDGILLARQILLEITNIGLPVGCEFLDVFLPQYYSDLISWGAIGARTTESQQHRQLASGLSMPIGFKNGTGGSIDMAADALICASYHHTFLGINNQGIASRIKTKGNKNVHIILRGSKNKPNYYPDDVNKACEILKKKNLQPKIMIDMSHGNSQKNYKNQELVCNSICDQIENKSIIGCMIESNINEGNQKISKNLKYGVSITDACINLETTEHFFIKLSNALSKR